MFGLSVLGVHVIAQFLLLTVSLDMLIQCGKWPAWGRYWRVISPACNLTATVLRCSRKGLPRLRERPWLQDVFHFVLIRPELGGKL
jgi:hypothetical protein